MDTKIWGPPFWFTLHTISLNYPLKPSYIDKQHHSLFFQSLKNTLPCVICRNHYSEFLNSNPIGPYLDNRNTLIEWVLKCHNNVNKINNKKQYSKGELINYYNNIYNNQINFKCSFFEEEKAKQMKENQCKINKYSNIVIIILFIIIFCLYIFKI
jgi:hypothetical protein